MTSNIIFGEKTAPYAKKKKKITIPNNKVMVVGISFHGFALVQKITRVE